MKRVKSGCILQTLVFMQKEELGFSISKKMFQKYTISSKNGNKFFVGTLKNESIDEFLGFDMSDASDMVMNIEISNTGKVKNISLEYIAGNGNKVVVFTKIGYTQVIKFNLPVVE